MLQRTTDPDANISQVPPLTAARAPKKVVVLREKMTWVIAVNRKAR
jgi:hypothetical protein